MPHRRATPLLLTLVLLLVEDTSAFTLSSTRPVSTCSPTSPTSITSRSINHLPTPSLHQQPTSPLSSQLQPSQRTRSPIALAPSGIDGLPLLEQSAIVAGIFGLLGAGSTLTTSALQLAGDAISPGPGGIKTTVGGVLACLIGALFCFTGWSHFAFSAAYEAIYPPPGTWGFWYLPGSASFHVQWSGVAEILGGLGLLLGGVGDLLGDPLETGRARPLRQVSASALFVLMVAVFPANVYEYTHGAIMVGLGPGDDGPLPLESHYARLVVQIVLLSLLSLLSREEGKASASS